MAHARESAPRECCGLLFGDGEVTDRVMRGINIDPDPERRYRMDGRQVLMELKPYGDDEDRHLVGIYHSHTRSIAYPSATDVERADFPRQVYLLISVREPESEIRAFRINKERKDQEVHEIPIVET